MIISVCWHPEQSICPICASFPLPLFNTDTKEQKQCKYYVLCLYKYELNICDRIWINTKIILSPAIIFLFHFYISLKSVNSVFLELETQRVNAWGHKIQMKKMPLNIFEK